tara:strand:- start:497 stop:1096 length:600 start_codon:yes stop_codon:yes gene_type:complete
MKIDEVPSEAVLPTPHGQFKIRVFKEEETGMDHVALTMGDMSGPDPVLVRVHSECLTGDAFGSLRCDCGPQLQSALDAVATKGWGVVLYLRQEGRGIGLHAKIQAYYLQDQGADTLDANLILGYPGDARNYNIASTMLDALGVSNVCLLSNNPDKVKQLQEYGINVVERVPLVAGVGKENIDYLQTKADRMGHDLNLED